MKIRIFLLYLLSLLVLAWNGLMLRMHNAQFRFMFGRGVDNDTIVDVVRTSRNMLLEAYVLSGVAIVANLFAFAVVWRKYRRRQD